MTANNNPEQEQIRIFFKTISIALLGILFCFLFNRCAPKPLQNTKETTQVSIVKKDSSKTTTINKAILDSLFITVEKVKTEKPECDSITQANLDQILKQLNSHKKSGDNEAGIYYDQLKKMIVAWQKVGQTQNEQIKINSKASNTILEKGKIEVPVKYIPTWIRYLSYLGIAFIVFLVWRFSKIWL